MPWLNVFERIASFSAALGAWACSWLLQSTVLILMGLLAASLLRRKGAACASAVYRAVLVAVLVCPAMTLALQWLDMPSLISLPGPFMPHREEASAPVSVEKPALPAVNTTFLAAAPYEWTPPPDARPASFVPPPEFIAESPLPVPDAKAEIIPATAPPSATIPWPILSASALPCAWLAISGVLLFRLVAAWRRAARLRQTASPVDEAISRVCESLAARIGVRAPAVVQSPFLSSPVLIGLRKPSIVLPEANPARERYKDIFIHELAHLARGDIYWKLLAHLSTAVLFFQPLLWLLVRRLADSAEEVCDDYVVHFGCDRTGYVRRLVEIAEQHRPLSISGVGVISFRSSIRRRIERILDTSRRLSTRLGSRTMLLIAATTMGATCLAGMLAFGDDRAVTPVNAATAGAPHADDRPEATSPPSAAGAATASASSDRQPEDSVYLIRRGAKIRVDKMEFSYEDGGDVLTVYNLDKTSPSYSNGLQMHIKMRIPKQVNRIDGYEVKILGRAPDRVKASIRKIESQEKFGYGIYFHMKPGETVGFDGGKIKIQGLSTEHLTDRGDASVWFETTTPTGTKTFEMFPAVLRDVGFCTVWVRGATDEAANLELMDSPSRYRRVAPAEGRGVNINIETPGVVVPFVNYDNVALSPAADAASPIEPIFQGLRENWDRRGDFALAKWNRMSTIEKARFINYWGAQGTMRGANWSPSEEEAARFVAEQTKDDGRMQRPRLEAIIDGVRSYLTPKESAVFDAVEKALINQLASLGSSAVDDLIEKIRKPPSRKGSEREPYWASQALALMGEPALPAIVSEIERVAENLSNLGYERNYLFEALTQNGGLPPKETLRRWLDNPQLGLDGLALGKLARMPGELSEKDLLGFWENNQHLRSRAGNLLADRGGQESLNILQRDIPTAYAQARFEAEAAVWQIKKRLGLPTGKQPQPPQRLTKGDDSPLWVGFEKSLKSPNKAIRLSAVEHLAVLAHRDPGYVPLLADVAEHDSAEDVRLKAAHYLQAIRLRRNAEQPITPPNASSTLKDKLHDIMGRLNRAIEHARIDAPAEKNDQPPGRQPSPSQQVDRLFKEANHYNEDAVRKALANAIDATAALGPAVVPLLLEMDNETPMIEIAHEKMKLEVIKEIGKPAVPALVKATSNPRRNVSDLALFALILLKDKSAIDPLLQRLHDKNEYNAIGAINWLARFHDPRVVDALLRLWDEGRYRVQIAWALGELGDPRAVGRIMAACEEAFDKAQKSVNWNEQFLLMFNGSQALGELGDPTAIPLLKKMLAAGPGMDLDQNMAEKKYYGVADNAAAALRKFGYKIEGDLQKGGYHITAEPAESHPTEE
jgi:beta-lactamase regulating signal transducer with metallopeptidase domain/HEAT repeat protein